MNDDSMKEKLAKQAAMLANAYPDGMDWRGIQNREPTKEETAAMYAGMVNVAPIESGPWPKPVPFWRRLFRMRGDKN